MIFRRKKQNEAAAAPATLRGRDKPDSNDNPLARRFHPEDEPDTIDLQQPAGFNSEPATRDLEAATSEPESISVITLNAETGKCYVQPGSDELATLLNGDLVQSRTELRRNDCVSVGDLQLQFSRVPKDE